MKIKTQFMVCIVVFTAILLVIAISIASTAQMVAQISAQEEISVKIERGASSLNSISIDYFLYQEDLQLSRWQSLLSSLSSDVSSMKLNTPEQQTLADNVADDLQGLNTLFDDVILYLRSAPRNVSVRIDPAFQIRWSGMAVESQALAFDASQLSRSLDDQTHQANITNNLLIVSLMGAFGALLATIYLMVFRRTLKSVEELQNGINTIGSGDLDYVIETKRNDEVTELSKAFNQMTANLKTVTASKTDLERTQASLRESEQRWETTLSSIGDAVIATDVSGKIVFMNGVAEELTGWKSSEALTRPVKHIFNIVNEQTRQEVEDPVAKVLEKGMVVGLANHTVLIRKDGTEVAIDDSGAPIRDREGKTTGVVLIFRDITKRKQSEDAISRQASLIDLSPDAILVKTLEGAITFWSGGAQKLYGWTKAEAVGQTAHDLLKTKFPDPLQDIISQVIGSGQWSGELQHTTKDGHNVTVQSSWLAEREEQGRVKSVLESNVDITQRKQMQDKLEEYSRNLEKLVEERTKKLELNSTYARNLIEASLDPLVTIDKEGKITDVNKATEDATGCSREELIGSDFSDYFTEPDKAQTGYKKVFTEGFVKDYPLAMRHKTGRTTYVLYNASIYQSPEGEVQGVFAAARDITERKKAEEQAQEAAKKLKDAERLAAIGATAGMVGHDIRNPLQSIVGDLYLAKEDLNDLPRSDAKESMKESLDAIENSVVYINKIVADLQDFARPLTPHHEEIDLEAIVDEVLAKNGLPENIGVTAKIARPVKNITADPAYLKRIVGNLVSNAVQAMPNGGKLAVTAKNLEGNTVITVTDTGAGIPEDAKPRLFQPLFTTKSKGQGFGLAVVKRMTEALGGTVTFTSEQSKGTTFIITLPQNF